MRIKIGKQELCLFGVQKRITTWQGEFIGHIKKIRDDRNGEKRVIFTIHSSTTQFYNLTSDHLKEIQREMKIMRTK